MHTPTYFPAIIDVTTVNGQNGFQINGALPYDQIGGFINGVGDVNGDGIEDMLIGAPYASFFGSAGACYIIFGKKNLGSSGTIEVNALDGTNGFTLVGVTGDVSANIGDINGDGFADIIIGSSSATIIRGYSPTGACFVVFGKTDLGKSGIFNVTQLNGNNGFIIFQSLSSSSNEFCSSVSTAGDVNHDNIMDIAIGSGYTYNYNSYIVFGNKNIGITGFINVTASLKGPQGFIIPKVYSTLSSTGDVNGDGITDLIISAPATTECCTGVGSGYVVFGATNIGHTGILDLTTINGMNGFVITGVDVHDTSSSTVNYIGDVNGDGIDDAIIGVDDASPIGIYESGGAFVIFGRVGGLNSSSIDLSLLSMGGKGFIITGTLPRQSLGSYVSDKGDFNGDGIMDIALMNFVLFNDGETQNSYVFFGKKGISDTINQLSLTGQNGFAIVGAYTALNSGNGPANMVGDINDDGISDLVVGSLGTSTYGKTYAGSCYVLFGDVSPQLIVNHLIINQGQTVLITQNNLNATDANHPSNKLQFVVNNVMHGYFTWSNGTDPIYSFSQQSIKLAQIQFTHDSSTHAPSYNISIYSSGFAYLPPQTATITFNAAPILVNNTLLINQGQNLILTPENLAAIDADDHILNFTISQVQHGQFSYVTKQTFPIFTFFQQQIIDQQIQFTHDGSIFAPSYWVTVNDGRLNNQGGPVRASINFDRFPLLTINQLAINQGQTLIITANNLKASSSTATSGNLLFIITNIQHGYFQRSNIPGVAITSFSQAEIMNGVIRFVHDGTRNPPGYTIQVSDGRIITAPQLAITHFNLAPLLIKNQLTINPGQTILLTVDNLNATDSEIPAGELLFIASDIQHGFFANTLKPKLAVTSFYQQQITNANILFTATDTASAPSYEIAVNDGNITTTPAPAIVNYNLNTLTGQSGTTLQNLVIAAATSGSVALIFLGLKYFFSRKASRDLQKVVIDTDSKIEKEQAEFYQAMILPLATKVFEKIDTTNFFSYRSEKDSKAYVAALETIVGKLGQQLNIDFENMQPLQATTFIQAIVEQIKKLLEKKYSCCSIPYWCSFFRPEVTIDELEDNIDNIVQLTRKSLTSFSLLAPTSPISLTADEGIEMQLWTNSTESNSENSIRNEIR